MNDKNKLNGLVLLDKEGLGKVLDNFREGFKPKKPDHYNCDLCGHCYPENDIIEDEEIGLICKGCAVAKKELDDEMEATEKMRDFRKEEMKGKAGYFDKEGP